jgi:hypothetical protein
MLKLVFKELSVYKARAVLKHSLVLQVFIVLPGHLNLIQLCLGIMLKDLEIL